MLTEEDAKTKLCPIVSSAVSDGCYDMKCIASQCMAWRWDAQTTKRKNEGPCFSTKDRGYCGIAGAPQ